MYSLRNTTNREETLVKEVFVNEQVYNNEHDKKIGMLRKKYNEETEKV